MEYIENCRFKEKLSIIGYAPHGIDLTSAANYSNYYDSGGNVFHLHGEGNEMVTRRTFGNWLKMSQRPKKVFTIFQVAHNDGDDPERFHKSRFSLESIEREINFNLELTGLDKIDAIYLADDNTNYPIALMQETIHGLIKLGYVNYVGLFNWSLKRVKDLISVSRENKQESISFILTTEYSILKPNFGVWTGYTQIDKEFEDYIAKEDLLLVVWTTDFNQSPLKTRMVDIKSNSDSHEGRRLTSKYNLEVSRRINDYCHAKNVSPSQVNISFLKNRKFDTIMLLYEDMGPKIEESIKALSIEYDESLWGR